MTGRFLQEDVYRGDGLNLYAYCANNPVKYYDPSGYMSLCPGGKTFPGNSNGGSGIPESSRKLNSKGVPYPEAIDPRTGKNIPMPEGELNVVSKDQRVEWNNITRSEYIKEWYDRGFQTPPGGWKEYDIHHILPREYGGTNVFENLVPIERTFHQTQFNPWWMGY